MVRLLGSFRYTSPSTPRVRTMGLGALSAVSLDAARKKAVKAREKVQDKIDPLDERRGPDTVPSFQEYADVYVGRMQSGWKARTIAAWHGSLSLYAYPKIGAVLVDKITDDHVMQVVKPIRKPITKPPSVSGAGSKRSYHSQRPTNCARATTRQHGKPSNTATTFPPWRENVTHYPRPAL